MGLSFMEEVPCSLLSFEFGRCDRAFEPDMFRRSSDSASACWKLRGDCKRLPGLATERFDVLSHGSLPSDLLLRMLT